MSVPSDSAKTSQMLINGRSSLVDEAIQGLLRRDGRLALLDDARTVVLRDSSTGVAVISGGGSGHEPAHAGLVGRGALSAAVCGDVFASPSVAQAESALRWAGERGALVVVKNYTGDRLTFGLAAARARSGGVACEVVVVGDDVATEEGARRGLAGTLFVHKMAGAMASEGESLETMARECREAASEVWTLGASLGECNVPRERTEKKKKEEAEQVRLKEGEVEVGMGIHNEAGCRKQAFNGAAELVADMLRMLREKARLGPEDEFAMIVNNLGGCSGLEMGVLANECLSSAWPGRQTVLMAAGTSLMTSLDMHGFSVSIMRLTPRRRRLLELPCEVLSFRPVNPRPHVVVVPPSPSLSSFSFSGPPVSDAVLLKVISACRALQSAARHLDALDKVVGDGDCGTTLAGGASRFLSSLPVDGSSRAAVLSRAAAACEAMGGSSGVLLGVFFLAAASATFASSLADCLTEGLARLQEVGGAQKGSRTMVDALAPAIEAMHRGESPARAARIGADSTKNMAVARAGRSAYLNSETLLGHSDPGAEAVAIFLEEIEK